MDQQQTSVPTPTTGTTPTLTTSQPIDTSAQPHATPPPSSSSAIPASTTTQLSEQQQQQQQQQQPKATTTNAPPYLSSATVPIPTPNPNPTATATSTSTPTQKLSPSPSPSLPQPQHSLAQPRPSPGTLSRPWQQHSNFPQFSSSLQSHSLSSSPAPLIPSSASTSISVTQRGGIAIGVPAASHSHPGSSPSPQPAAFSGSFGQQFGALGRGGVNAPESSSNSNAPQARQSVHGMGMMGSLGSSSQVRPSGLSMHHQQRPIQSALRPQSSLTGQSPATQSFQGHSMLRASPVGSPGSTAPSTSQSMQSPTQPWLSSGPQGKPPLPPSSYRPQMNSPSMQQRSHIPQQHHPIPVSSQQQHLSSAPQQQSVPSHQQPQEQFGQQYPSLRPPQSLSHQQQTARVQGLPNQKPSTLPVVQPNTVQSVPQSKAVSVESEESCSRILSKRSISELVNQIDSSEKLDPEVEEILVDIAEDFVESITTFGCSLAKHRKSDTLEAKDILLHLERNWNMTLPGFSSDEIKAYRKPLTSDIHKERLALIKRSSAATEVGNSRNPLGQATVNVKGNLAKTHANLVGSPNFKVREVS